MGLCSLNAARRCAIRREKKKKYAARDKSFFRSGRNYAVRISRFRGDIEISESQETFATIGRIRRETNSRDEI